MELYILTTNKKISHWIRWECRYDSWWIYYCVSREYERNPWENDAV